MSDLPEFVIGRPRSTDRPRQAVPADTSDSASR
jgi:hypothetical protein